MRDAPWNSTFRPSKDAAGNQNTPMSSWALIFSRVSSCFFFLRGVYKGIFWKNILYCRLRCSRTWYFTFFWVIKGKAHSSNLSNQNIATWCLHCKICVSFFSGWICFHCYMRSLREVYQMVMDIVYDEHISTFQEWKFHSHCNTYPKAILQFDQSAAEPSNGETCEISQNLLSLKLHRKTDIYI